MKVFTANKLTHTLQTYLGMIRNEGKPHDRLPYSSIPKSFRQSEAVSVPAKFPSKLCEEDMISLFVLCVLEYRLPQFNDNCREFYKYGIRWPSPADRLRFNIMACCRQNIDLDLMKMNIQNLQRLDLEQAAGIVISAINNDGDIPNRAQIVEALVRELDYTLITESCMWFEDFRDLHLRATSNEDKLERLVELLRQTLWDQRDIDDWETLLTHLLRIRRVEPRSRCLIIPQWIFEAADMAPPPEFAIWDGRGRIRRGSEPVAPSGPSPKDLVLGRKQFRAFQRKLLRCYRFWEPEVHLRNAISDLKAEVIYSRKVIKSKVMPSQDTLLVAHYFFAFQRRLQRKVVSNLQPKFLEKGESGNVYQNNPQIQSTFEQRLSEFSGQSGVPLTGPIAAQIDQCCLLMEGYVLIYGRGDFSNLVFSRGTSGGSGRGAVDDYNLLCDILDRLGRAAKEQGIPYPGPVQKFLAKDIMAWNKSFGDDAFANGRVPGWKTWLDKKREAGLWISLERLKIDDDIRTEA